MSDEFLQRVHTEAERLRARHEAQRIVRQELADREAIGLPRLTLKDALREDRPARPPQRIAQMHEVGHNSTITAKFKTGKTTLGGNMLRSLADGEDFLDRYPVRRPEGRIGLLNYELTDYDMLDWLDDQGIRRSKRIALLNLRGVPFTLASPRNQEELVKWCLDMEIEVLHLDPHRRAFKGFGSENSNDDVNAFTDVLDTVKKEAGVLDLFLYVHSGRAVGEMGSEHARGATALDDWADNRWILTKDEHDDRFLYADGRTGFVPEFRLNYNRDLRRLTAEDGNRRNNAVTRYRETVLTALEVVESEGAKVGELEQRLEIKKAGALSPVLRELVKEGLVVQVKEGNAKRNYLKNFAPSSGAAEAS